MASISSLARAKSRERQYPTSATKPRPRARHHRRRVQPRSPPRSRVAPPRARRTEKRSVAACERRRANLGLRFARAPTAPPRRARGRNGRSPHGRSTPGPRRRRRVGGSRARAGRRRRRRRGGPPFPRIPRSGPHTATRSPRSRRRATRSGGASAALGMRPPGSAYGGRRKTGPASGRRRGAARPPAARAARPRLRRLPVIVSSRATGNCRPRTAATPSRPWAEAERRSIRARISFSTVSGISTGTSRSKLHPSPLRRSEPDSAIDRTSSSR